MTQKIARRSVPDSYKNIDGIPLFLKRIYSARGISSNAELSLSLKRLHNSDYLLGLEAAVKLLTDAIQHRHKIIIVGDFDCDGATSTALAMHALKAMGAVDCQYLVPNRFEFGYGLTPGIVELAASFKPDLIVTVDNGISSIEGAETAKKLGIKVLVTDHHLPGDQLPDVDAIVNPNQHGCQFQSKNAAGVGVIFYVLNHLRSVLREMSWFKTRGIQEPNMGHYLDLVALGTVADLVPLDRNNRILVEQGLQRIRAGRCRPGIKALLAQAQKKPGQIKASDMGFIVGPRLNAAGRLDDMSLGIECLLAEDDVQANQLANKLDQLNQERKTIEQEMKLDAEEYLKALDLSLGHEQSKWGLCLYEAHWHQGVIGILASRIKERCHRPVIAFAPEDTDPHSLKTILKGSARSIPGFHMRDALDLIAKRHPDILSKFGGHAMAAGMSIEKKHLDIFSEAFDRVVKETLCKDDLNVIFQSDGEMLSDDLTLDNVRLLENSGPWGQQFPEPSFDGIFNVVQVRILKDSHLKLVLSAPGETALFDAIQFNSPVITNGKVSVDNQKIRIVYRPNINEFRGRQSVQFMIDYIELAQDVSKGEHDVPVFS